MGKLIYSAIARRTATSKTRQAVGVRDWPARPSRPDWWTSCSCSWSGHRGRRQASPPQRRPFRSGAAGHAAVRKRCRLPQVPAHASVITSRGNWASRGPAGPDGPAGPRGPRELGPPASLVGREPVSPPEGFPHRDLLVVDGLQCAGGAPHCPPGPGAGCRLVGCHRAHHDSASCLWLVSHGQARSEAQGRSRAPASSAAGPAEPFGCGHHPGSC